MCFGRADRLIVPSSDKEAWWDLLVRVEGFVLWEEAAVISLVLVDMERIDSAPSLKDSAGAGGFVGRGLSSRDILLLVRVDLFDGSLESATGLCGSPSGTAGTVVSSEAAMLFFPVCVRKGRSAGLLDRGEAAS